MRDMKYFTIEEMCQSQTAKARGITNRPNAEARQNLTALIGAVLDPLRERWGRPIKVTSGYRCAALNKAIGGAAQSQHMKGEAADIVAATPRETAQLGRLIVELGAYDQVIFEQSDAMCSECQWIHVSWKRIGYNRRNILRQPKGSKNYLTVRL